MYIVVNFQISDGTLNKCEMPFLIKNDGSLYTVFHF